MGSPPPADETGDNKGGKTMKVCDDCGSSNRVEVFIGGSKACDNCVVAMMSDAPTGEAPAWTRNEDHLGGLAYCD